jgi:hypothetical protein
MSFTSFPLEYQLSVATANHALGPSPSHDPSRGPDGAPRNPGPGPNAGAQDHERRLDLPGPGRAQDRGGSRRMERCMDCTSHVSRRSSAPSRPARYHQSLACHSPPFRCVQADLYACRKTHPLGRRATVWATGGLALGGQPCCNRARRQILATLSQPAPQGTQVHPPGRRSREPAGSAQVVPGRSIPHRARSWARRLVVPFRQILAHHSPPSNVNHRPDVSLRRSARAE